MSIPAKTPDRAYAIGLWSFDTVDAVLKSPDSVRKLEDRAARTLTLLCEHRGEIVSQATILAEIWGGRAVSPNSVAIVIADLRRALGEDARNAVHIETIAKRGYRLADELPSAPDTSAVSQQSYPKRRLLTYLAAATAVVCLATASITVFERSSPDISILVEPVSNDTGEIGYRPVASAMSELLINRIAAFGAVKIFRSTQAGITKSPPPSLIVRSRLILWNGIPTLSMTSEDHGGHVVWTGMAVGSVPTLAGKTITELAGFQKAIRNHAT